MLTGPQGHDAPGWKRPSVGPLHVRPSARRSGTKLFGVYSHPPYPNKGTEAPSYKPKGAHARRIQMGNLSLLTSKLTKLYGPKHLWITEYGYQTNPPDKTIFGISWSKQALYMKQAYAMARKNPRIDMMLWFLVGDEPSIGGWQWKGWG